MSDMKAVQGGARVRAYPSLPFLDDEPAAPAERGGADVAPAADGEEGDVAPARPRMRPQQRRRQATRLSLLLLVVLPTLLGALYYGLIASDQYAVEVRFAVRGANAPTGIDLIGAVTGAPGPSSTLTDAYIVMDYIRSREFLERIQTETDVRAIYGSKKGDFLARFDTSQPIEEFVTYWRSMVEISFDTASQIIAVKVRAFTPEESRTVANGIIKFSEELINRLSERARLDAVKFAEEELRRSEDRLKVHRTTLRSFRDQQQEIDPLKKADSQLSLLGRLEAELSAAKARMTTLRQYMGGNAPTVTFLENQIKALEHQVEQERAKLGKGTDTPDKGATLSGVVAAYEELVVDREFAEKAYVSALSSLERARAESLQQQRYLAVFVRPSVPQEALYPRRLLNTFMILLVSGILWSLGLLMVYAIRDHSA